VLVAACNGNGEPGGVAQNPGGVPQVAGTYTYQGGQFGFFLRGSITFEQTGDVVRVTGVTYDNANDRDLVGEATLAGNELDIELTPKNGDPDFRADVTFIFAPDGSTFEVAFSDTNGDAGDLGSYVGTKQP